MENDQTQKSDNKITILAVDDVEFNLDLIEVMLAANDTESETQIDIIRAQNGREGLDKLNRAQNIDIILLDLEMPVMNGFEMLQTLKSDSRYQQIPVIVITTDKNEILKTLAIGANDFLSKPYNPQELKLRVMNHVKIKKLSDFKQQVNEYLEEEVRRKTSELHEALKMSKEAEYEISLRLGKAAEYRDMETGMHTVRISYLSSHLASLAGLDIHQCEILKYASPLHDVGKIGISDLILLKPAKLTAEEFEIMKSHTIIGGKILSEAERYPVIEAGRIVAEQHHERWDGNGYPNQLKGEEIHIFGRIVMIVDVFDALASERPYKKAFPIEKVIEIMEGDKGKFFDPKLFEIFMTNLQQFVEIKDSLKD